MTHYIGPDVTSGTVPEIHAGINYKASSFTMPVTASGSVSIAMMRLPGGARVVDTTLTIDNSALQDAVTANATQRIELWTGGTVESDGAGNTIAYIKSSSMGNVTSTFLPNHGALNHRATSSSHVVLVLQNPAASGTVTTIFNLAVTYITQDDPDG